MADEVRYRLVLGNGFEMCPQVMDAGNEAVGAWVLCALWSAGNKTPGDIPAAIAAPYGRRVIGRLVRAGMWAKADDGYRMLPNWYARFSVIRTRGAILESLRVRVYSRDGHQCVQCGSAEDLTLDHIHPHSRGGADTEENLQTLCRSCNSRKGARV